MTTDKFRILAVDDDKDILDLIHFTLGSRYEILTLKDSGDACEILEFCEPDAVILDIMMPKVTGYHIAEHLRKEGRHQDVRIVFLSAKDTPRDIRYGYKIGANLYVTKPFQPERLIRTLDTLMTEGGQPPRQKTFTLRQVEMRVQLQTGFYRPTGSGSPEPAQPVQGEVLPLKRHDPQDLEDSGEAKWVG